MKNCPYCSQPIYNAALRCPFCGRNLDFELAKKLEKQKAEREALSRQVKLTLGILAIIGVVLIAIVWTAVYSPMGSIAKQTATQTAMALTYCDPVQVRAAAQQLIGFNDRWFDIKALAVSVDRSALVLQVDRLQKIRRDARDVDTLDCMHSAKASLISGMDDHITGFLAHIRLEPLEQVNEYLMKGNFEMNSFADEVERLQRCAPGCQ